MQKDNKYTITVIMPVYNTAEFLPEAVESILAQSNRSFELICVDDGSTDGSLSILNKYASADSRIKIISQSNHGQGYARNRAVEIAQGEFIYFMDSDDVLEDNAFQVLLNYIRADNLDLILFSGAILNDDLSNNELTYFTRSRNYPIIKSGSDLLKEQLQNGDFIVSPCLYLISKKLVTENCVNFLEGEKHEDDIHALLTLYYAKRVRCVPDALFLRRIRSGSTMMTYEPERSFRGMYKTCLTLFERFYLSGSSGFDEVADLAMAREIDAAVRFYSMCGKEVAEFFEFVNPDADTEKKVASLIQNRIKNLGFKYYACKALRHVKWYVKSILLRVR